MTTGWTCLLVNLTQFPLEEDWQVRLTKAQIAMETLLVTSVGEAIAQLDKGGCPVLIIFVSEPTEDLEKLLNSYQYNIGCLNEFQAIICDDPSPVLMATAFEFGTDQFFNKENWIAETALITKNATERLSDLNSTELKIFALTQSIKNSFREEIKKAEQNISEVAIYDYRAAFAKGRAYEAVSAYEDAAEAFENANAMNRIFRPSSTHLGEVLLTMGRVDDAIYIFSKLAKSNPWFCEHQANLAMAYIEKQDFKEANVYIDRAKKLSQNSEKVKQAEVYYELAKSDFTKVINLLSELEHSDVLLATKLNRVGIQLSKSNQPEKAIELYRVAHKIVNPAQQHKLSLNMALACFRMNQLDNALAYLDQSAREYGGSFQKLDKVREAIMHAKQIANRKRPTKKPSAA